MPSYSRARRVGERFPIRNSAVGGVLIDRQRLQRMRVDFGSELEISDEARCGELDLDAELGASNALERGGEPLVLLDAPTRHEPGASRRPVHPAANEQAALCVAYEQIER